ncbi:uncharacterized protein BCR38DRAFT_182946 [Pseudomassariella vexata]|uniref:Apple domain-containing protein n=1 Tax=Pseudomassariella vexata TaxID=1141098 RepID=A0A1Y2E4W1_9PEZI|nr:uncharacterized protein BCR38DRAFT_182946 [Pseudomassariella vexata]ORY66559.1 hypothetical protein BCR38DRAFT_182946 [Pseudomassariella vexata]
MAARPDLHEQAGLEVAPEPEAPHVIQGPHVVKTWDTPVGAPYPQQQHQHVPTSPEYGQLSPQAGYLSPGSGGSPAQFTGSYAPSTPEKSYEPRIMGIRRRRFWLIFGPLIAILVIGLAVGLGVGLGTSHSTESSATTTTSTLSTTSSTSTTSSSPTATATTQSLSCPSDNATVYTANNDDNFLVLCNLDYNSGGGTTDMSNLVTATAVECANTCASNAGCVGAGWGNYEGSLTCWMKSGLGEPQDAVNWYFMVKQ